MPVYRFGSVCMLLKHLNTQFHKLYRSEKHLETSDSSEDSVLMLFHVLCTKLSCYLLGKCTSEYT